MKQFKPGEMKVYTFIKYVIALCISIIFGMLMLIAVYLLPIENMKANVARSSEIFNYEGIYPQLVNGYKYMQLDNFTDSIMLGAAIYDGGEGTIKKAASNYYPGSEQLSPELALTNYANEVSAFEYFRVPYGRYWHGYLVPLKLLLLFFDYADIRVLNFFMQNLLLFSVLKLLCSIRLEQYIPAFLITVFVINPLTAAVSLQFSSVYYVMLLSVIYLLWIVWKGRAEEKKINFLFFITGVLTAYLDLLTYPLVPCGILIVLYLVINRDNIGMVSVKAVFQKMLLWCFGYGGMWSGKWLVSSILRKENMFGDALNQIAFRASLGSMKEAECGRLDAIVKNISVFMKWPFLLAFLWLGILAFGIRKLTRRMVFENAVFILLLIAITFLPIGWMLVMAEHSYSHYWFTYKEFAISSFALLSLGIYLKNLTEGEMDEGETEEKQEQ